MENKIKGKVFVLGDNIDTDQIIPAHHLVYDLDDPKERQMYGTYALSGVPEKQSGLPDGLIPFMDENKTRSAFSLVIGGSNFGCGSSREHAPVAMQMAGVRAVIAKSYARIFYRNSVDGGFIIPFESENNLSVIIKTGDTVEIDTQENQLINSSTSKIYSLRPLGDVAGIIEEGGLFQYAKARKLM